MAPRTHASALNPLPASGRIGVYIRIVVVTNGSDVGRQAADEETNMCDDRTVVDNTEYLRAKTLTRRQFGAVSAGAGLAMLLPRAANAQAVSETELDVRPLMVSQIVTSCIPRVERIQVC